METPIIRSFTWLGTSGGGRRREDRWTRQEGEEGKGGKRCARERKIESEMRSDTAPPTALMETRKQQDFSLLCVRKTETEKESSMTNGISSTGGVNISRKVPGFQDSTVLSANCGNK